VSTADALALAAATVACVGAIVVLIAAVVLVGQVRRLERGIDALRGEALEAARSAREAAGSASEELARVDAVLAGTESVTASVDQAARLAERAFANPVVKLLAWRAGARGAFSRLAQPVASGDRASGSSGSSTAGSSSASGAGSGSGRVHRRRRDRRPTAVGGDGLW
jgi:hypothetical protein